jgi:hypothetical protein
MVEINPHPFGVPATDFAMGFNIDSGDAVRNAHPRHSSSEGLLCLVRMQQNPLTQNLSGFVGHSPGIRVMFPTGIAVTQSCAHAPRVVARCGEQDFLNGGLAGLCRGASRADKHAEQYRRSLHAIRLLLSGSLDRLAMIRPRVAERPPKQSRVRSQSETWQFQGGYDARQEGGGARIHLGLRRHMPSHSLQRFSQ